VIGDRRLEVDARHFAEGYAAWMPDGRAIVFSSLATDRSSVWIVRPDGSAARQLGHDVAGDGLLYEVAPDGTTVEVVNYSDGKSWLLDVAAGGVTNVELGPELPASWQRRAP